MSWQRRNRSSSPGKASLRPTDGSSSTLRGTRVSWIGPSYGFGPDLAYFRQVFAEFVRRFRSTVIHVHQGYPTERYPELPLRPDFEFRVWDRKKRLGTGIDYTARFRVPTPSTVRSILRDPAEVFVIVEFSPTCLVGWVAAKLQRRRVVVLVECDPAFRGGGQRRSVALVKGWVARHSDAVLTSNEHGRRYLVETLHVPADLVLVGPYLTSDPGADLEGRFHSDDRAGDGRVRLLFLNTLSQRKGIVELVEALAALPSEDTDRWTLSIVGSGDLEPQVRELVEARGLSGQVRFVGRVPHDETPSFYADADVVVCPTLGDYRSLAGIEAVNAGRAVIVSVHDGAAQEIMEQAPAAWLVDPIDVPGFTETLHAVLADPGRVAAAHVPPRAFAVEVVGDNLERAVELALS